MSKHTPGPWRISSSGNVIRDHQPMSEEGELICEVYGDDNNANAQLIAAAPDLLEALEAITYDGSWTYGVWAPSDKAWDKVYAAIAKAKGE